MKICIIAIQNRTELQGGRKGQKRKQISSCKGSKPKRIKKNASKPKKFKTSVKCIPPPNLDGYKEDPFKESDPMHLHRLGLESNLNGRLYTATRPGAQPGRPQTVVYAGGAPGTHIQYLSDMFDDLKYNPPVLFISDIRSTDWEIETDVTVENRCSTDMMKQMRWHEIMKPDCSMLKFRLPWGPGKTEYLDGDIYIQAWGPITTTETRLWTKKGGNMDKRVYDNERYERECFHHNTVSRVARYPHDVEGEGIDRCYDCTCEVYILKNYLRKWKSITDEKTLAEMVSKMSFEISRTSTGGRRRTLASGNLDPTQRRDAIRKCQWINSMPAYSAVAKKRKIAEEIKNKSNKDLYSTKALNILKKSGFQEGEGLGVNGRGIRVPLEVEGNILQRGIGWCVSNAFKQDNNASPQTAPQSTAAQSPNKIPQNSPSTS
ncbi:hypothetical protein AAMO2058_001097400 [Amorphochlora amoebiformis]